MNLSSGHKGAKWQGWRVLLQGCPKFLQWAMWILSGYAWVYIVLPFIYRDGVGSPLDNARRVSSVFLAIYSAVTCVLYSLTETEKLALYLCWHRLQPDETEIISGLRQTALYRAIRNIYSVAFWPENGPAVGSRRRPSGIIMFALCSPTATKQCIMGWGQEIGAS